MKAGPSFPRKAARAGPSRVAARRLMWSWKPRPSCACGSGTAAGELRSRRLDSTVPVATMMCGAVKVRGAAAIVEDADGGDAAGCLREQLGGVGVGVDGNAGVGEDVAAEGVGEVAAGEGGPFREAESKLGRERDGGAPERGEERGGEGEGVGSHNAFDLGVVRFEVAGGNRPGGGGYAGGRVEDIGRVGQELTAPAGRGAAEGAEAAFGGAGVNGGGKVGVVEGLGGGFEVEAAGFEEGDVEVGGGQVAG